MSSDTLSRRTLLTRPNNVSTTCTYDSLSRLLSVLHQNGGTTIDGTSYTVDAVGNRTAKTDLPTSTTSNFTYDAIYQLTQVVQGLNTTESYTYDGVGNRLSSLGISPYAYNSSNQLTSIAGTPLATFTYDNNGNTTSKTDSTGTTNYSWDYENRLTSVTLPGSGGTVSFKCDLFGRRIYKSSSSGTSIFAYDGDNLIEETNSSGTVVARYSQSLGIDEPLAMLRSGATSYYHADGLGSVTSLSNSAGARAQTYGYDTFGKQTNSSGSLTNPFQYTARELDSDTMLYFMRARYFDPSAGRLLSEDPTGFAGGVNEYAYALNSPATYYDPLGLDAWKKTHSWGRADIQAYSNYMKNFVKSYGGKIDCADLALLGLINFASSNGLPVNLKYYSNGGWSSYNAQSSAFSSVQQYTTTVLNNLGALNVIDNTHAIKLGDLEPGDLVMTKYGPNLGHTRIVTGITCDQCNGNPTINWYQGNLPPRVPEPRTAPWSTVEGQGGLLPPSQMPRRWNFGSW